jgi:hypothetical protein
MAGYHTHRPARDRDRHISGCGTRLFALARLRVYAWNLRRNRSAPTARWHLDEMVVKVGRKRTWLWRAVDDEGEVLEVLSG